MQSAKRFGYSVYFNLYIRKLATQVIAEKGKNEECMNFLSRAQLVKKNKPNKNAEKFLATIAPEINWKEYLPQKEKKKNKSQEKHDLFG